MINVKMKRSEDGKPCGFRVSGHAGYSESGTDIVCAGVSVLSINTVNSIEKLSETEISVINSDKEDGILDITCKEPLDEKAVLLLESFELGIQSIRESYGEYVTYQK